jgi:hypothetical protein
VNRRLVGVGVALLVAGALILSYLLLAGTGGVPPSESVPLVGEVQGRIDPPTRLWSILAGFALASGAACVGIGMNRWNARASTSPRASASR